MIKRRGSHDREADFLAEITERLAPIDGVTSRAMFGGYGIFHDGNMFALISKSTLYLKVDDSSLAAYERAGSQWFKPMPYYEVPADVFEDTDKLTARAVRRSPPDQTPSTANPSPPGL